MSSMSRTHLCSLYHEGEGGGGDEEEDEVFERLPCRRMGVEEVVERPAE